jgi:hypothetical protein
MKKKYIKLAKTVKYVVTKKQTDQKKIVNYFEELPRISVVWSLAQEGKVVRSRAIQYQKNLLRQIGLEMEYKICLRCRQCY